MATRDAGTVDDAGSDYQKVGGGPAVTAVVDRFYELLQQDPRLASYLDGQDGSELKQRHVRLVSQVLGGGTDADPGGGADASPVLTIDRDDYVPLVSYLMLALQESGVDPEIIVRTGATLAATERDIVALIDH
ncbi:MAG: globin domain-containing protein [Nocardioidaceae bacterium]